MSVQTAVASSVPKSVQQPTEFCNLEVVDWSIKDKQKLAQQIIAACRNGPGFFYLTNHGLEKQRDEMFRLCEESFKTVPIEEKEAINMTRAGIYMGWKPLTGGNEFFNVPKFNKYDRLPMVSLHEKRAADIERFSRDCHALAKDLLSIFAIALGFKDERWFDARHDYEAKGGDHIRFINYPPASTLPDLPIGWDGTPQRILAHTDFGSLTLLFNQHVAGLQILNPLTNTWQFVQPRADGGIVINVGDALQAFTAGFMRSSWHRVVAPPKELGQEGETRYSLVYFSRPNDDVPLLPLTDLSDHIAAFAPTFKDPRVPVDDGALPPTFGVWMARRAMNLWKPETNSGAFNWVAPDEQKGKEGAKL